MQTTDRINRGLAVEAAAAGLGYASVLCWASTCLVATFGGAPLASPFWPTLPWLRTDTTGVIAFALAAVSLAVSKYLRLRRLRTEPAARPRPWRPAGVLGAQAIAETAAILTTGLVAYLSLNVVTHSVTLRIQLTHLLPWPSEGTVRVIALAICVVSVAVARYLRASAGTEAIRWPGGSADRQAKPHGSADRQAKPHGSADRQGQPQVLGHDGVRQV